jgi:DNA-directed RNA polymerase specialized sigma24 family protein
MRVPASDQAAPMHELQIESRFRSILEEHGKLLRNAIAAHCPRTLGLDLDDILQEARLRLWRAISSEKEIRDTASYLFRIAANVTIDAVRANAAFLARDVFLHCITHHPG